MQSRFTVDEAYANLLLKMVGARWRESKSKLVSAIRVASTCPDSSSRLAMLRPDNVENVADWNDFVKEKLSEKFTVINCILFVTNEKVKYSFINEFLLCSKQAKNSEK